MTKNSDDFLSEKRKVKSEKSNGLAVIVPGAT